MTAVLDLGIDLDVWPWIWLGVAVVFALVELTALAGSFVLLPFAVSGFAASLAGFYDVPVEGQWAIFVFGGAALWMLFWKYARRFVNDNAMPDGVGADRLVGLSAIVTSDIDPDDTDRRGRVKVVGEDWGALTEHRGTLRAGAKVKILSMEGTRVIVEPLPIGDDTSTPPDGPLLKPPLDPPAPPDRSTT
ncbi:MAG: NfeD family protein [Ilumatobacter sp.]